MHLKTSVFLISFFLLFSSISTIPVLSTHIETKSGITWYVDANGESNYTRIQDAIDNASDSDTIFVYNGCYMENIIIDKSIELTGENRTNTIITGMGTKSTIINILSDRVTINNFTIQNGQIGIEVSSSSNTISRNHIKNHKFYGIYQNCSSGNLISKNVFADNDIGIMLFATKHNNIKTNILENNTWYGLLISASAANNIMTNSFVNNDRGIGLMASMGNRIKKNNFINNDLDALFRNNLMGYIIYNFPRYSMHLIRNIWLHNYWDECSLHDPKVINGMIETGRYSETPWINIDWYPSHEPFEVDTD